MMIEDQPVVDHIEREFVIREQQDELRDELSSLLNKEKGK